MDKSLKQLCGVLKKILSQRKPQQQAVSFLLLTGKSGQGKTTLLQQSNYQHTMVHGEKSADIYYNQHSVILELGEAWLNERKSGLQNTLKHLNRCHRFVKISGIILCLDVRELFIAEPLEYHASNKAHSQFLQRLGLCLNEKLDTIIVFTKMDIIAGFCDFFQNEHPTELSKPLGFSLHDTHQPEALVKTYQLQFEQFIETLGQQIIKKIHPTRSSTKRTLIREFPLQLASMRKAIQSLIQHIPPQLFRLNALYFTSAEQGHVSLDKLNKKIQNEYALTVQDQFPQSTNYQSYFIDGLLEHFHHQTKRSPPSLTPHHRMIIGGFTGLVVLTFIWIFYHHVSYAHILDKASKELIAYDTLVNQKEKQHLALQHLTSASNELKRITSNAYSLPFIEELKSKLRLDTQQYLNNQFLPNVLADLEGVMNNRQLSQEQRYQALKVYLMFADPVRFSLKDIEQWYQQYWQGHASTDDSTSKLALLKQALKHPRQPITINQQLVSDVRNDLNALPANYLYYRLAKQWFPKDSQSIQAQGFIFKNNQLPSYLTKNHFNTVISQLPEISSRLHAENWVLERNGLSDLTNLLQQAYCYEYVTWWKNFLLHTKLKPTQDYEQTRELARLVRESNALTQLVELIQQHTAPESDSTFSVFNQEIASHFTELSFISHSTTKNFTTSLVELERFLTMLSLVKDEGRTAFTLAKARFQKESVSNPLSAIYERAQQMPEPVSQWAKQLADDTWNRIINDSRNYINHQWNTLVFPVYETTISKRFPFDSEAEQDISLEDFNQFFSPHGVLNQFVDNHLKPFLDTSQAQWTLKETDLRVLPMSPDTLTELIRANIITNMFFPNQKTSTNIKFSLQKISLDPFIGSLRLTVGENSLMDTQETDGLTKFAWPSSDAKLILNSIEGQHYVLEEKGEWAFFKMLQKVNVLVDEQDASYLQILFEINGNSGRYLLKTHNALNPFTPGILNGFSLPKQIV